MHETGREPTSGPRFAPPRAQRAPERPDRVASLRAAAEALFEAATPAQVAQVLVRSVLDFLEGSAGAVGALSEDGATVRLLGGQGYGAVTAETLSASPLGAASPLSAVVRTGHPIFCRNASERRARFPALVAAIQENGPGALAAIPLVASGRPIGALVIEFAADREFADDDELAWLFTLAGLGAMALERARLFEGERSARREAERAAGRIGRLQALSSALSMALSADEVADVVIAHVIPTLAANAASVLLVDAAGETLELVRASGYPEAVLRLLARVPLSAALPTADAARTGELVIVDTAALESAYPALVASWRETGYHAVLAIPLHFRGRPIGAVGVSFLEAPPLAAADKAFFLSLGRQCAMALERARLYEAERRARQDAEALRERAERLHAMTAALSKAVSREDVAAAAVAQAKEALGGVARVSLWDLSPDGETLDVLSAAVESARPELSRVPLDSTWPLARAAASGSPLWYDDRASFLAAVPSPELVGADVEGAAAIPLHVDGDRLVGVLAITALRPGVFTADQRSFLLALTAQAAQALDRARLYELERRSRVRFALLAEASRTLSASLDYAGALRAVAALALPTLGDACFFDVIEAEGELRRFACANEAPALQAALDASRWVRPEAPDDDLTALSTGRAELHADLDDAWWARAARSPEQLGTLTALAPTSWLTVPLVANGRVLGALTLVHGRSKRRHPRDDFALAYELAHRAAGAVANARLVALSRRERDRAEEASRLKDDFLATVSHELRTPLTAILGWAQLLDERHLEPSNERRAVETIARNARLQAQLIDDLLDVSRIVSGKLRLVARPMDLAPVVDAAAQALLPAAQAKGVTLEVRLAGASRLSGDPDRLQQVFWNLLSNALKFTPRGGRVRVEARSLAGRVEVSVADSGRGIPAEFLPHAFDRFRQADSSPTREHGGLGLGLSIVRHLVELHGGEVRAESGGEGKGARFTVTLPVGLEADDPSLPPGPPPPEGFAPAPELSRLHLLVVDDDDDTRALLRMMLEQFGARVTTVDSAVAALRALGESRFDVLVSDVSMPGADGYQLVRELRASGGPSAKVAAVALTANARPEDRALALAAGYDVHVAKPIEPRQLAGVLERLGRRNA